MPEARCSGFDTPVIPSSRRCPRRALPSVWQQLSRATGCTQGTRPWGCGLSLLHLHRAAQLLPQQGGTRGILKHSRVWGKAFLYACPRAAVIPGSARPGCPEDKLWLPALCLKLCSKC